MTLKLGLTGSIGMGKSTTSAMFREAGISIWDADATVHQLYGPGGKGADAIAKLVPEAVSAAGVDRSRLRSAVLADETLLPRIEEVIHPLVAESRKAFLEANSTETVVLFDIPLLFETNADAWLDKVIVVTAPEQVQRNRVLARPGMTEESYAAIIARQIPDADKRTRASYVIDTSMGLDAARVRVQEILGDLNP